MEGFRLPRLSTARIAMACRLYEVHEVGPNKQAMILGEILSAYVDDAVAEVDADGRVTIHPDRVDPIGRLGANAYATFGKVRELKRP